MTFYQRATQAPTSLRSLISCCYGGRLNRPASPDDRPASPPGADEDANEAAAESTVHKRDSWIHVDAALRSNGPRTSAADALDAADGTVRTTGEHLNDDGSLSESAIRGDSGGVGGGGNSLGRAAVLPWAPASDNGPRPIGALEIGVRYNTAERQLAARVIRTLDLRQTTPPTWNSVQVSLALLPARKVRHRTEMAKGDNPNFGEGFVFPGIYASEMPRLAIRFRAYGCERKRRKQLLGECTLALASVATEAAVRQEETLVQLPLLPCSGAKSNVGSDTGFSEASSTQAGSVVSVFGTAELFLGLCYNAKTGQLAVEVLKGSGFKLPGSSRAPETIVKMSLMASTSQILFKTKTTFALASPNPMWKENFMFPVNRFQLSDVTIVVTIYAKKSINRREMIGWFAIGRSSSGEEELAHWQDMLDAKAEQVSRWHRLLHPDEKK